MLPTVLPPNPNLEHLKKQAKDFLKSYRSGDPQVCSSLQKYLPRFSQKPDRDILSAGLSLHDAQCVVARAYGFDNWAALCKSISKHGDAKHPIHNGVAQELREHIDALGFPTIGAYRIWCRKQGLDSGVEKTNEQLQHEKNLRLKEPPQPTQAHRRGQAEKITRVYQRVDTKGRLVHLFDATQDEAERDALYQLLIHIEKYTRINWDAAAQLARYHRDWCGSIEEWFPKSEGRNRQLAELTHYLLGREDVILFRNAQLLQENGPTAQYRQTQSERVLSQEEITSFEELGYIRVPQAFPRDAALEMQAFMWSELNRLHGFDRNDPGTWKMQGWTPVKWTRLKLNQTGDHPVYKPIASPCLLGAYSDLAGSTNAASKQRWGPFRIHFPEQTNTPWSIGYNWEMWGTPRADLNTVLGIYTFYSHVAHQGGGPFVVEGSHRLVMSFFDQMTPNDLKQKRSVLKNRFLRSHPYFAELSGKVTDRGNRIRRFVEETTVIDDVPVRVVELTGEPGDAIIYHPALLRGTSPNLSDVPRFVRG